jgi:uncharacterized protein (DUF1501 family)
MNPFREFDLLQTRRQLFGRSITSMSSATSLAALGTLLAPHSIASQPVLGSTHSTAKAKRVIYLFMSGAPSQLETFDYKPKLREMFDKDLPASVRGNQRLTTMTSGQGRFPIAPSIYSFKRCGSHGAMISELLPHIGSIADDITIVKTVHTEAINHDPAITFIQTGSQLPGRPSIGAWLSYGLGSNNADLPAYVVMTSTYPSGTNAQALFSRLWSAGFLPSEHQGVALRGRGDPVLYLNNPSGIQDDGRRKMLDAVAKMNARQFDFLGDPETNGRIAQYELAYRMQHSMPELMDFSKEPAHVLEMYGPKVREPGSFAANCLLARRLAERDVRFVQVFTRGWDVHGNAPRDTKKMCDDVDQPSAALVKDLKQRGLLDDTLVVWGGEFGRTVYSQGGLSKDNYGRDHHPRNFPVWMAGGGIKKGMVYGETDDFSYNIVENPVHIHDLNATVLHLLGIDHEKLTYRFQGRDFRLTDVHGKIVKDILA